MLTTRVTHLEISQGRQMLLCPYVIFCNNNFIFKMRRFYDIRLQKCDLKIRVRGHSRSLKVVPFDRLRMICY